MALAWLHPGVPGVLWALIGISGAQLNSARWGLSLGSKSCPGVEGQTPGKIAVLSGWYSPGGGGGCGVGGGGGEGGGYCQVPRL